MDMIELLFSCGFDTLEYSWVKATIGICMLTNYSVAKECQQCGRRLGKTGGAPCASDRERKRGAAQASSSLGKTPS
jgi:hypothetical protein